MSRNNSRSREKASLCVGSESFSSVPLSLFVWLPLADGSSVIGSGVVGLGAAGPKLSGLFIIPESCR